MNLIKKYYLILFVTFFSAWSLLFIVEKTKLFFYLSSLIVIVFIFLTSWKYFKKLVYIYPILLCMYFIFGFTFCYSNLMFVSTTYLITFYCLSGLLILINRRLPNSGIVIIVYILYIILAKDLILNLTSLKSILNTSNNMILYIHNILMIVFFIYTFTAIGLCNEETGIYHNRDYFMQFFTSTILIIAVLITLFVYKNKYAYFIYELYGSSFIEEIFFRGILIDLINKYFLQTHTSLVKTKNAIFSSVIFSLMHLKYGLLNMAISFLFGLLLFVVRKKVNNIYVPTIIHSLWNTIVL